MNEMRKLMESIEKVAEDYYDSSLDVRAAPNKIYQQMEEGILDPRIVAEAALSYLSEAQVADMGRANDWYGFNGEEDDFEESVEVVGEAYDDELDQNPRSSHADQALRDLIRDLQQLERNTARVFAEAQQSQGRPDYAEMLLNELSITLTEISDIVEKYEDF